MSQVEAVAAEVESVVEETLTNANKALVGKGVKVKSGTRRRDQIIVTHDRNLRNNAGQTIEGFKIERDRKNVEEMVQVIRDCGGLPAPLVIVHRADGTEHLNGGHRRIDAIDFLYRTEPLSELVKSLRDLPVVVWYGLTEEQERELMNDQRSQTYVSSEILREFDRQLAGLVPWRVAAKSLYRQIAYALGSSNEADKRDAIADPIKREKEIGKWLQTSGQQFWETGLRKLGPKIRELMFATYLFKDGMISKRPEINLTGPKVKALSAARNKDVKSGQWNAAEFRGPEWDKVYDALVLEEAIKAKEVPAGEQPHKIKLKKADDIQGALVELDSRVGVVSEPEDAGKASLCGRILRCAESEYGDPAAIAEVMHYQQCKAIYVASGFHSEILEALFNGSDPERFKAALK